MNRRLFLSTLSLALAESLPGQQLIRFSDNPFQLGVASGDPLSDGVVLWTRLLGQNLSAAASATAASGTWKKQPAGFQSLPTTVDWRVATDDQMRNVVKKGKATATGELAHSVHVEVNGLQPNREYWYQFSVGNEESPVGRTRTAPAPGATLDRLKFAFASCQHFETGYFTAYDHLVKENPDLIVFLGDYIYENGIGTNGVRKHTGPEIFNLADYRKRYALYKGDQLLQRAHAHAPWIVTWDDHEVDNDYANDIHERHDPRNEFMERRACAYQAYYEHQPLRIGARPKAYDMELYRRVNYGGLAQFHVIDTRQYRNEQPCGRGTKAQCAQALDPKQTILGEAQTRWLLDGLGRSQAKWNVLANQVIFAKAERKVDGSLGESMDKWGGYESSRKAVMDAFSSGKVSNPVVLTGDSHANWAFDLKKDWKDQKSASVGVEFGGTSISSGGDGADKSAFTDELLAVNPHLKLHNTQRGYVSCLVTAKELRTDYRIIPYVTKEGAPVTTRASFIVEAGNPKLQKA